MSKEIIAAVEQHVVDGFIGCEDAHQIAASLAIAPAQVGVAINTDKRFRFDRCQLGLFGFGDKAEGKSKVVLQAKHVPPEIEADIDRETSNGRISCLAVWQVAAKHRYPRLAMANIIETKGLKVTPCQLKCF